MKDIELKKGNTKTNSRDLYWQKSYVEFRPLENELLKLLVVISYEYAIQKLGFDPFQEEGFKKVDMWLTEQTNKLFDEFKLDLIKPQDKMITRLFLVDPIDFAEIDNFIENEI